MRRFALDRDKAETSFYKMCDKLFSKYDNCYVNYDSDLDAGSAQVDFRADGHIGVNVGVDGLFPRNYFLPSNRVDAITYIDAVQAVYHECEHVEQMLCSNDPSIRLSIAVAKYNQDLSNACYKSDPTELEAEMEALKKTHVYMCTNFGQEIGDSVFKEYVIKQVSENNNYFVSLRQPNLELQDVYDAFEQKHADAVRHPMWYPNRSEYDWGTSSVDMVLRVLADPKWDGAEAIIRDSGDFVQSHRRILVLCAQEDPEVLRGVDDLHINVESEFPAGFLKMVRQREHASVPDNIRSVMNEYERMRESCDKRMYYGCPLNKCRVAIFGTKVLPSGDVCVRAVQACDLVGVGCPASVSPDLYVDYSKRIAANHYVTYSADSYGKMMSVANCDGDKPVFYANLVPVQVSDMMCFMVDPNNVFSSDTPFSLKSHKENVEAARNKGSAIRSRASDLVGQYPVSRFPINSQGLGQDAQYDDCKTGPSVFTVRSPYIPPLDLPPLEPEFGSPDGKDDFGPSL